MDHRRCEFQSVPPHHGLHVVGVAPEGVEGTGRVGRHVGVITDECAAEVITAINRTRTDRVGHIRCDIANEVVKARVVDVGAQIRAIDPPFRRRRPREAGLPRGNVIAPVSAQINVSIRRGSCSAEDVLDRTCRRRGVKCRSVAAVRCLAAVGVRVRRRLRDRIAVGSPGGALVEDRRRIGPRRTAIC